MPEQTYGHTPVDSIFTREDVYGIAYSAESANLTPIRLGIIGVGGVAQSKYLPAIQRLRTLWHSIEIVAVTTLDQLQGKKVAKMYGCRWYQDVDSMLNLENLDAVLVTSTDTYHHRHAMEAMRHHLHVLVEKPIATSLLQAEEMCRYADEHALIFMSVSNKRYSPPYFRAKSILQGKPGEPALFTGKFNLGYNYVRFLEGGTVHLFDIARYLMGDVKYLEAKGVNRYRHNRIGYPIDNCVLVFEFSSGAIGTISSSSSALSLKPWERVEVYGDGYWIEVDNQYRLNVFDGETTAARYWEPSLPNTLLFDEEFGGYMGVVENFCQAIRGYEKPLCTGWDGYRALELVVASHMSMMQGRRIELPLLSQEADEFYCSVLNPPTE